jgi:hypothetical protein
MRRVDRDALTRALDMANTLDPIIASAVAATLKSETWEAAARYAVYHLQMKSLRLRPWQAPPCNSDDEIDPAGLSGGRREEVALRQRMLAAGLSQYEPDPIAALAEAEADPLPAA